MTSRLAISEDEKGGDLRNVGERLVEHAPQLGNHRAGLRRGQGECVVVGAKMLRHRAGVVGLVVLAFLEADGVGLDRPRARRLHQRRHRARIDPAREKDAQRDVGDHAPPHRVRQQIVEVDRRLPLVALERFGAPRFRHFAKRPEGFHSRLGRGVALQG